MTPSAPSRLDCDVVVVGSGIAGLTAALEVLRLEPGVRVVVVTKGALGDGATAWAQGGIAAVLDDAPSGAPSDAPSARDAVALHVGDTLAAGDGLCVPEAVAVLCGAGARAVTDLERRGLVLDRRPDGTRARGLEAAHSRARVLHAGGDTTGAHVQTALGRAVRASRAALLERTALTGLRTSGSPARVTGVDLRGPDGEHVVVDARAVVLATGGLGQVYAHTTTPAVATGDGLVAAARAGALLADVEMVQFHPTTATPPGRRGFLVSEAVRGEGAVLLDARGRRFVDELAPRDVVARACAAVMAAQDGAPMLLDARHLQERLAGRGGLSGRFPGIDALLTAAGLDWRHDLVPVTPAAHYAMGGVRTDLEGRTSLPGLWAAGEVASSGVHGANRLASNSLLEGAVFGARAAADVVTALTAGRVAPAAFPALDEGADDDLRVEVALPRDAAGWSLPALEVRELAWAHAGLLRDRAGLDLAAKALSSTAASTSTGGSTGGAGDPVLTDVARLLVAGALAREESRGAHARTDHPTRADRARRSVLRAVLVDQP